MSSCYQDAELRVNELLSFCTDREVEVEPGDLQGHDLCHDQPLEALATL